MDVHFKICGSIRSEIKNECFVIAMCLENQPRWRRLQTINIEFSCMSFVPQLLTLKKIFFANKSVWIIKFEEFFHTPCTSIKLTDRTTVHVYLIIFCYFDNGLQYLIRYRFTRELDL